jgi:hypothetical protein
LASVFAWVSSYHAEKSFALPFGRWSVLTFANGDMEGFWTGPDSRFDSFSGGFRISHYESFVGSLDGRTRGPEYPGVAYWSWVIHDWFIVTVLIAPAVGLFIHRFLAKRITSDGFCFQCGYDLRATPDRCPECGTIPPPKKEITAT